KLILLVLTLGIVLQVGLAAQESPRRAAVSVSQSTPDFESLRAQATSAREKDRIPEALRLYQKLVTLRPNWAEGWWFLGVLNYDQSRFVPASSAFGQFVRLEPDNGQGWGMLGLCEAQMQKIRLSLTHLDKAMSMKCGGNEEMIRVVRYNQAALLSRVKEFESALGLLSAFAVEHRESKSILDAMGMAILRKSQPLDRLSSEERTMVREFGRAIFLEAEQKLDEAGRLYDELEAKYRGKPNVAYAYGVDLYLRHQYEESEKQFKKELERDPNHVAALLQLANYALMTGALDDGLNYARKAVKLAPMNGIGYYFLGRIHMRRNELSPAVAMLEKSAQLEPEAPNVQYSLSQAYSKLNRPEAAARARAEYDRLEALFKRRIGMVPFEPKEPVQDSPDASRGQKKGPVRR
ncbi:MAG TPA: tetratricopeptide repeat protein, partial [Acidobacteriota bacterium]|nr:tetratricopeptide repeat protein [Acidobacteriota bacterium]